MAEKTKTERLNLTLLPEVKSELEEISEQTGNSMVSVLLKGFKLFKLVHEAQQRGARISVTEADGTSKELLFLL